MSLAGRNLLRALTTAMSKKSGKTPIATAVKKNMFEKTSKPDSTSSGPVSLSSNGSIQIPIHVKPGAKSNCITDVTGDYWSVQISAPPTDGEANAEIIKFFAELLKLKKSDLELRGGKSRDKIITITSSSDRPVTCAQVTERLTSEIGKIY